MAVTRRRLLVVASAIVLVPAFVRRSKATAIEPEPEGTFEVMFHGDRGYEEWTLTPSEAYRLADEREAEDPIFAETLRAFAEGREPQLD